MTINVRHIMHWAIFFDGTAGAFKSHPLNGMIQNRFPSKSPTSISASRSGLRASVENPSRAFAYRAFAILFFLIFLAYSNTFHASWHFDDYPHIVNNPKIQISDVLPPSLVRSMQRPDQAAYWRPLAYLTFSLNWFAGGNEVFGYHFVNILLHSMSACLLFLTVLTFFQTPTLQGKYSESVQSVALLARHPRAPDYLNLKGAILMQQGKEREALRFFHDAIHVAPKRLPGIINAGKALMALQAYANAEKLYKYAIELDSRNLMTNLRLIDVNLRSGDTREAEELLRYLVSAATVDDINASLIELSEEPLFDKKGSKKLTQSVATALKKTYSFRTN